MNRFYCLAIFLLLAVIITPACKTQKNANTSEDPKLVTSQDYLKKGNIQLDLKKYKEALKLLDKAVELDVDNGEAYAYRGMAKYNLKDLKGALVDYNKALEIIPDYGEVYDLRGIVKAELGDKTGACEDWNQAFNFGFNKAAELIERYCSEENN